MFWLIRDWFAKTFFPKFEQLEFLSFFERISKLDPERLNLLHGFLEKQYFSEMDRRKGLDEKARALLTALLTLFSLLIGGSLISNKAIPSCLFFFGLLLLFTTVGWMMVALWPRSYDVPQQRNFLNEKLLTLGPDDAEKDKNYRLYLIYLVWEYYQCWINNHSIDEGKGKALKWAYGFLAVTLLAFFIIALVVI